MESSDLETSVTALAKVGSCWSPSFSPDGTRVAFISNLSGTPGVWIVNSQSGWPRMVVSLKDPITLVTWSPDGEWLAFHLSPGGGMNTQIYVVHPDGTGLKCLSPGGKEGNWINFWSHDSQYLAFSSNRRTLGSIDVYLYHVPSGEARLVSKNTGDGRFFDLSRDGRYGLVYRMAQRSDSDVFLVDMANGSEVCLTPHAGFSTSSFAQFTPDGCTIYLVTDVGCEMTRLGRISLGEDGLAGPIETVLQRDDAEVHGFAMSKDGSTAAIAWNMCGLSEMSIVDLKSGRIVDSPKLPAEVVWQLTFSQDGSQLIFNALGPATPLNVFTYNLVSRSPCLQITHSHHPGVDLAKLVRPKLFHFLAHDGLKLSGWLYIPSDFAQPGAVVIEFHGGPEGQSYPVFEASIQGLLSQGIAVFTPNVRGSSGSGKTFVNLDNGRLRFNAIRDIKSCADYILGSGVGARGKLGIMGRSYGGYMTMSGLAEYPDLFGAGVNIYGIVNFRTFFEHTEPWMREISKVKYGDPYTEGEMLDELSPINKIDRVTSPVLVLHGANDTNVPLIEAEQAAESLERRKVPVKLVVYPDEGHGFVKEPNRISAAVAIAKWFAMYLLDGRHGHPDRM